MDDTNITTTPTTMIDDDKDFESNIQGAYVYVSGPISGLDYENVSARFQQARKYLISKGARYVWLPTAHVDEDSSYEDAMFLCLNELVLGVEGGKLTERFYNLFVSLPGWQQSKGATLERLVAESCGIRCADLLMDLKDEEVYE